MSKILEGGGVKVSRSRKKNCRAITSPKNKQTNLFFYPDDSEILEIKIQVSSISESSG